MSRLSSQRTYPSFPVHLVSPIVRICKTLRYHLGEVRSFYRFPRRLRLPAAKSFGVQLILFGIPFGDWNRMLADPLFWDSVGAVSEVWRIPAFRFLLSLVSPMAVVIPMKGEHAIAAARSRRGLFPDERALRILNNKREFQSYIESNGLDRYCPPCYACPEDATFPCVVKRLDLSGSVGIEVAASRRHLDDILRTPVFAGRPYLLQALVLGELEYATFCVADRGRITWHWTFVSTMAGPAVVKTEDNDKDRRTIEAAPGVLQQIEAVLRPLAFGGPCIVNYKMRENGDVQVFEINPRFGGSLLQPAQAPRLRQAIAALLRVAR